jgi:hypothetical protein
VPVDPAAYEVAADGVINFLIDALAAATAETDEKPAFDDPAGKLRAYLASDDKNLTLVQVANLFIAVGFKIHEKARVGMAEQDLGVGQFNEDVKAANAASERYALPQQISTAERALLDTSMVKHNSESGNLTTYPTKSKLFKMKIKNAGGSWSGQLEFTVRAPAKRVLAYYMGWMTLYGAKMNTGKFSIIERENDHCLFTKYEVEMPYPLKNRESISNSLWEQLGNGDYFVSQTSCSHPACPTSPDKVRMDLTRTFKLKQISASLTSVTLVGSMHLRGSFPASINSAVAIPVIKGLPPSVMLYFAATRPADEFDDGDSTELGQLVILRLYPHRGYPDILRKEVNELISVVNVLRSFQAKYRFLDEFLYHITMNKVKIGAAQTGFNVNTPLAALTTNGAGQIARSFSMLLMSNVNGEAAVDEFILTFPALEEMDFEYNWFKPTMVAVANELMSKVAYGVRVRACIGGSVSMLDLVSDTVIVVEYIATGRNRLAYLLIGMVAANMIFQLLVVWGQTRGLTENRWRTMMLQMLATVLFIKPGLDSWKVASGAEQLPGAVGSPLLEMMYCKGGEMVFEAVPGMILQFFAILMTKNRSTMAVVSLLISAASTGLTATTLFFDVDVDPGARKRNPAWVGAVPDQGRGLAFASAFTFCTLHVMAKGAATALLYMVNPLFLVIYIAVDYGLLFIYMAVRKDLVFFAPMPPAATLITSPIFKTLSKVAADFSGSPSTRLPMLLGGSYYIFNQFSAQASVLIAVHLYNLEMAAVPDSEKIAADKLWMMAGLLVGSWFVSVLFFLTRIVTPSHRHTFWSPVSGRQCVQEKYTKGTTDEGMLTIFSCSRLLWESDIGSEVMEFTLQNWGRWERDKPSWFTAKIKAEVPDEYIPKEHLAQLGGANRIRRGSAAGSVRESFRLVEAFGNVEEEEEEVVEEEVVEEEAMMDEGVV